MVLLLLSSSLVSLWNSRSVASMKVSQTSFSLHYTLSRVVLCFAMSVLDNQLDLMPFIFCICLSWLTYNTFLLQLPCHVLVNLSEKWSLWKVYYVSGMHPRVLVDGFEIAKRATLQFLDTFKTPVVMGDEPDKEILKMVARTTLRTKVFFVCWYLYLFCYHQLFSSLADGLFFLAYLAVWRLSWSTDWYCC